MFLARTRAVTDQKQPCVSTMQILKGNFCLQITTPEQEGTFRGIVRELMHVIFRADFSSVSVTQPHQGGICQTYLLTYEQAREP